MSFFLSFRLLVALVSNGMCQKVYKVNFRYVLSIYLTIEHMPLLMHVTYLCQQTDWNISIFNTKYHFQILCWILIMSNNIYKYLDISKYASTIFFKNEYMPLNTYLLHIKTMTTENSIASILEYYFQTKW